MLAQRTTAWHWIIVLFVWLLLGLSARSAGAAVWTVEKDGSGDFTVIQDALDAAAEGDTVDIPDLLGHFRC